VNTRHWNFLKRKQGFSRETRQHERNERKKGKPKVSQRQTQEYKGILYFWSFFKLNGLEWGRNRGGGGKEQMTLESMILFFEVCVVHSKSCGN